VRDTPGARGIEVLLLERATSNDHTSGMWVFPGGVVEERDRVAPSSLDLPEYRTAAIRECEEECGIALASLADVHPIAHWITPRGRAKRFDTWFFVAIAPEEHDTVVDGREILSHKWIAPHDALAGEFGARLMTPTRATLQALAPFTSCDAVIAWAQSLDGIPCIEPWLAQSAAGLVSIAPDHPAYDKVRRLDPEGRGTAWCEPVSAPAAPLSAAAPAATCAADRVPPRRSS
jgi:8-oxo-dGTP pyrophosphatase MutT (NUDIX family)